MFGGWYTKQSKYIQKNLQQIIPKIIINFRIPPNLSLNPQLASRSRSNRQPGLHSKTFQRNRKPTPEKIATTKNPNI
jgi:hypothetical protein